MESTFDTSTKVFNTEQLRNFALAMRASSEQKPFFDNYIADKLPSTFKALTYWIVNDYENNYAAILRLSSNLSNAAIKDELQRIDLDSLVYQESFNSLKYQIENRIFLDRSPQTKMLAQQVADMDSDNMSVEEWATKLSKEISEGVD